MPAVCSLPSNVCSAASSLSVRDLRTSRPPCPKCSVDAARATSASATSPRAAASRCPQTRNIVRGRERASAECQDAVVAHHNQGHRASSCQKERRAVFLQTHTINFGDPIALSQPACRLCHLKEKSPFCPASTLSTRQKETLKATNVGCCATGFVPEQSSDCHPYPPAQINAYLGRWCHLQSLQRSRLVLPALKKRSFYGAPLDIPYRA